MDLEEFLRNLLKALSDGIPVAWAEGDNLQEQHIEGLVCFRTLRYLEIRHIWSHQANVNHPLPLPATINGRLLTQSGKSDILIIRSMKKTSITVTEASRNFADCVNRAHYQNVTFVLLKNGEPVARLVPDRERVCVGRDLAEALAKNDLPENEARVWHRDLEAARKSLKAPADKWR
jgi:antitoxin (DNA-binding transcriptional repressor) of toxin-antitoxin stability system